MDNDEQESYFDRYEYDLVSATQYGVSGAQVCPVTAGNLSVAHVVLHRIDPAMALEFLDGVVTGAGLPVSSAAYVLREKLNRGLRSGNGVRFSHTDELYLLFRAWNAYRKGETLTKLQLPQGGVTPENFVLPV